MKIVTARRLNDAMEDVAREFRRLGIWNARVYSVEVYLVPLGGAYGWKCGGASCEIVIPAVSFCRLAGLFFGGMKAGLRDILRHEYGHAIADLYPHLSRSRVFHAAFGGSYDQDGAADDWDPELHITPYAAKNPCEDFAELFMLYVKHAGRLPESSRFRPAVIRRKWRFVDRLVKTIRQGRSSF